MKKIYWYLLILFFTGSSIYFFYYFWHDVSEDIDFDNIQKLIQEDRNTEALNIAENLGKKHSNNGMLFYFKGVALKNLGKYDEAIQELDKAIRVGYPEALAYNLKSFIYGEYKHNYEKQIYYAKKSLEIDPSDSEAHFLKAMAYKNTGKLDLALENIERALKNSENDYDLIYERAKLFILLGRNKEAVEDIIECLDKYPAYAEGWFELYKIYLSEGKISNAFYCILKARKYAPENIEYLKQKAFLEERVGNFLQAYLDMNDALMLMKNDISSDIFYFISKQLYRNSDYKGALKTINKAIGKSKKAEFYELRGKIYLQLDDFREALKNWNIMARLDSNYRDKMEYYKNRINCSGTPTPVCRRAGN